MLCCRYIIISIPVIRRKKIKINKVKIYIHDPPKYYSYKNKI